METAHSLIDHLVRAGVLNDKRILAAFSRIDRRDFVPAKLQDVAYEDIPLPIGCEQTISQPFTVAFMLSLLNVQEGDKVLDVGAGSGYTTALLADLVGPHGKIIGVEIIPELVTLGSNNLNKYNFTHAEIRQSGSKLGIPADAPYDEILVSAEAMEIPNELVAQLKVGGRMVIPIARSVWVIEKLVDGSLDIEKHDGFIFVPLVTNTAHLTEASRVP